MLDTKPAALLISLLVTCNTVGADSPEPPAAKRPNVVLICLEGVPAEATGFGGHPVIKTPHLDQLAAHSTVFSRAYTPMPQCTGCQASLLTGQYPHVHGVPKEHATLPARAITVSEMLNRAGYSCGLVGIWQTPSPEGSEPATTSPPPANGRPGVPATPGRPGAGARPGPVRPGGAMHPPERPMPGAARPGQPSPTPQNTGAGPQTARPTGLAETQPAEESPASAPAIGPASAPEAPVAAPPEPPIIKPGFGFTYSATSEPGPSLRGGLVRVDGKEERTDKYLPDWHTARAVEFIGSNKSAPFFLAVFLPGPPDNLDEVNEAAEQYPAASLPLPERKSTDAANTPGRLRSASILQRSPKDPQSLRRSQSKYYSFLSETDRLVGKIVEAMQQAGVDRNTLLIVTSSQGYATGQNEAWGMGPALWEPLVRCPLIVRAMPLAGTPSESRPSDPAVSTAAPLGQATGANRSARVVNLVDVAPTILEIVGLDLPPAMQGRSLLPLLRGQHDPYRSDECFVEYEQSDGQPFPARALISEQYKFVDYLQDTDFFYDLLRDPLEQRNYVDEPAYASIVKVMKMRLEQWRKRTKDADAR